VKNKTTFFSFLRSIYRIIEDNSPRNGFYGFLKLSAFLNITWDVF